jgi:molecular chaperone DnaK
MLRESVDEQIADIFDRQAGTARASLRGNRMDDAERAIHEMRGMTQREMWSLPSFLIYVFKELAGERHLATDKALHQRLVKQGETAFQENDIDALRHVVAQLSNNIFSITTATGKVAALAGLMRG